MGSRMWREASREGTRRSRREGCRESGGKGRREGIDGSGKGKRVENVGGGARGGVKQRGRSSGGLSVGERSVKVWGEEVKWVGGKRGRESMIGAKE